MYRKMGLLALLVLILCTLTACKCDHVWNKATCDSPKTCLLCDEVDGTALGHTYSNATCTSPRTCTTCGQTRGEKNPHRWDAATCESPRTCALCGVKEGEALGHRWAGADCETAGTCATCGISQGQPTGHSWSEATCESPKTCATCGTTQGRELGHAWVEASCEHPETCLRCKETSGSALGHSYGSWLDGEGDARYRICATCNHRQEGKVDRAAMGRKLIAADWSLSFKYVDNQLVPAGAQAHRIQLLADGGGSWIAGTEKETVVWEYSGYEDGIYRFKLIRGQQVYQMSVDTTSGTLLYGYLTVSLDDQLWVFKKI